MCFSGFCIIKCISHFTRSLVLYYISVQLSLAWCQVVWEILETEVQVICRASGWERLVYSPSPLCLVGKGMFMDYNSQNPFSHCGHWLLNAGFWKLYSSSKSPEFAQDWSFLELKQSGWLLNTDTYPHPHPLVVWDLSSLPKPIGWLWAFLLNKKVHC